MKIVFFINSKTALRLFLQGSTANQRDILITFGLNWNFYPFGMSIKWLVHANLKGRMNKRQTLIP